MARNSHIDNDVGPYTSGPFDRGAERILECDRKVLEKNIIQASPPDLPELLCMAKGTVYLEDRPLTSLRGRLLIITCFTHSMSKSLSLSAVDAMIRPLNATQKNTSN